MTQFKPQLAEDVTKLTVPVTFDKLVSSKLDGIRLATWKGMPLTRSLKYIPNKHVQEMLRLVPYKDGELIVGPPNAPDVYRKTFSGVMSIEGTPDFTYYVFDDLTDFSLTFEQRLNKLADIESKLPSWCKVLQQTRISNQAELEGYYAGMLDQGYEGAMARNPSSMYKFGRCTVKSQDSLKIKPFRDDDAVVLSVYEAEENLNEAFINELGYTDRSSHSENKVGKGMAGGFIARELVTGELIRCPVGRMKHVERIHVWNTRHEQEGKLFTFRSMVGGVKDLPRHLRFLKWRSPLDL